MTGVRGTSVVQLSDVSVRLFLESQDHQHDLIRELQLIGLSTSSDPQNLDGAGRLAAAIGEVLATYSPVRSSTREQAMAALDRGEEQVTLAVPVQDGMAQALRRWLQLLEQADQLCQDGELLLLATRPEIAQFRRWYVDQITTQL